MTIKKDRKDIKYYKYDLPIPNVDPEIKGLDQIIEEEKMSILTINEKLWNKL